MELTGILNLDKPAGASSAAAVGHVKRILLRNAKVGHAGTLDPFATGVLLVLVGKATKWCERLMDAPKQYVATLRFGQTTPTDDPTEPATPWPGEVRPFDLATLERALRPFIGTITQRPPAFSALKVGGRPAYALARKGKAVQLSSRPVQVYDVALLDFEFPHATLRIDCGRGTYVRAIARDLGETLNVGAHLTALRRTRVGPFYVDESTTLDTFDARDVRSLLKSLDGTALDAPTNVAPIK